MSVPGTVLELALGRSATLGKGRLVCVDGPSGSGKTTLAVAIEKGFTALDRGAARVVHLDDLYAGWSGLGHIGAQLESLLLPLSRGRSGQYRRYDWLAQQFAEYVTVDPTPLLVLEGVGSGSTRFATLATVLVWVEAPRDVRMARGLARDGDTFAPHWEHWAREEAELFAREQTRARADVVVDGTGQNP